MYIGQENSVSEPQKVLSLQIVPNCVDGNFPYHRPHSCSGTCWEYSFYLSTPQPSPKGKEYWCYMGILQLNYEEIQSKQSREKISGVNWFPISWKNSFSSSICVVKYGNTAKCELRFYVVEIRATFLPVDSIAFFTACSWSKEKLWEITHIHVLVMLKHTGEA